MSFPKCGELSSRITEGYTAARWKNLTVGSIRIATASLTEPTGYWDGAVGFFVGESTAALRGATFHVRHWDAETGFLQIASPLPVAPVAGDTFRLFVGGKTASSQSVLSMRVAGKQSEIDGVSSTNLPGVTIRVISLEFFQNATN